MSKQLERLLSFGSGGLGDPISPQIPNNILQVAPSSSRAELSHLLSQRNGFYAFESALLVRPVDCASMPLGIMQWNDPKLWKVEYEIDLVDVLFFAEDLFGEQFCIRNNSIQSFDPETGEFSPVADSLEQWADWILQNHKSRTGWPLGHFWQLRNGELANGMRLLPKKPFVLGGEFTVENLYALSDVEGMRFRASIANQIRDCPDGTNVTFSIKQPQRRD